MKFINNIKKLFPKKLKAVLSAFRNLQPTTYHSFEPEGSQSLNGLQPSSHNQQPTTYNLQPNKGFTLIETLVAISILMIAVASPLTIAQKGLASAIFAKDQIIASYLAQDAIEYIINSSGRNVASGAAKGWLAGIKDTDSNNCELTCKVSTNVIDVAPAIESCSGLDCPALKYFDSSKSIYSQTGTGGDSPFSRTVTVEEVVPNKEALITVKMSWKDKGATRTLNFYTRIYNWRS